MIKFEIYSVTENIPAYPVTIYYSSFLIGNTSKCHLKIKSNKKDFPHLRCELSKNKATLETINGNHFFLNGKKVLGLVSIQLNDLIKLDDTSFRITEISSEHNLNELNHEVLYDEFYSQKEEYESILSAIEKELIYSTDDLTSSKKSGADEL